MRKFKNCNFKLNGKHLSDDEGKRNCFPPSAEDLVTKHRELQNGHDKEISKCYLPSLILKQSLCYFKPTIFTPPIASQYGANKFPGGLLGVFASQTIHFRKNP